MERLTYVAENGEVLFHPADLPDDDWGFTKLAMTSTGYKNGSLAVQDLLNGNLDYVIIDAAPAASITAALNAMQ